MFADRELTDAIPMLERYARKLVRRDREDLVQDTCLRALDKRHLYIEGNFGGWLRSTMYHLYVERVRVADKETRRNVRLNSRSIQLPTQETAVEISEAVSAIKRLPPIYRETMVDIAHELTYKEIADLRHVHFVTVGTRIHKARKRLGVLC